MLVSQDRPIADLVVLYALYGFVGVLHLEGFGDGLHVVACGYVEHFMQIAGAWGALHYYFAGRSLPAGRTA